VSLKQYVEGMPEHQKNIYYITGESVQAVKKSPFLEIMEKKNFEVLFLVQVIDEYAIQQIKKYQDKDLVCITKEGLNFEKSEEDQNTEKDQSKAFKDILTQIKDVLGNKVEKVVLSNRLVSSPALLVTGQNGWSANMERIVKAQAMGNEQMSFMAGKKILEVNPNHPLVQSLLENNENRSDTWEFANVVDMIYDTSLLSSGFTLGDLKAFDKRLNTIMLKYYCNVIVEPEKEVVMETKDISSKSDEVSADVDKEIEEDNVSLIDNKDVLSDDTSDDECGDESL
jgi:molecular chaperone HtpG